MKTNKIFALLLCLAIMLSITPVISLTVSARPATPPSYTLTVPAKLPVKNAGWNATDGITAVVTGDVDFSAPQYLLVTAESANEWQLKSESENTIGYVLTTEADGEQTTSWMFRANELNAGTTKAMGVEVEDYSNAPYGSYTDAVVFTASVGMLDVLLTKTGEDDTFMFLTEYRDAANNGEYAGWTVNLIHDVDLNGELWTPIECFNGIFDGHDYTISNLKIEAPNGIGAFFKSCADGATIKNILFEDVDVFGKYVAVVVGDAETTKNLTLSGISVLSGEVSATGYAAGIVFDAEGEGLNLQFCMNYATIEGWSASGIGAWVYPKSVSNSVSNVFCLYNYGEVTATNRAGGIFGNWGGAKLGYCHNAGTVTVCATEYGTMPAGGIVGVLGGKTTIEYCLNEGTVRNLSVVDQYNASAGGILGQNPGSSVTIRCCINYGNVSAANCAAAGIGVSLYGGIAAVSCHNEASVVAHSGNGGTKLIAAGIVTDAGMFGGANSTTCCLNLGSVNGDHEDSCRIAENASNSFYFDSWFGKLYDADGEEFETTDALDALNDGEEEFFYIDTNTGKIRPMNPFGK